MKKFVKVFVIIALAAVIGFSMAACGGEDDNNTDPNGNGDGNGNGNGSGTQKSITINGLTGITGNGSIYIASYIAPNSIAGNITPVAGGRASVSNDTLTVSLYTFTSNALTTTPWTGSGSHYIMINVGSPETTAYFYTEGKTRTELGITSLDGLPKYNINSTSSTIAFSQFKSITHLNGGSD